MGTNIEKQSGQEQRTYADIFGFQKVDENVYYEKLAWLQGMFHTNLNIP